jgi:hypothetical protein
MLISAAGSSSLMISKANDIFLDTEKIYKLSDDEFISQLGNDSNIRTKHIIEAYKDRRLYHPVYRLDYHAQNDADPLSIKFWHNMYPDSRKPMWRREIETRLERLSGLDPGTIVVYSPDRLMNMKEFEVLVQSDPKMEIKKLADILDDNRKMEMTAINDRFLDLWHLQVLVDPSALDVTDSQREDVQDLSALCEELIGFPNAISELQRRGKRLVDQVAHRVIVEYEEREKVVVPYRYHGELITSSHRSQHADILDSMRAHLETLMNKEKS